MPNRSSRRPAKPEPDTNETAFRVIQEATGSSKPTAPEKNPAAVALGRLGGKKGGKARAQSLSKARRSEIASEAAKARWKAKGAP